ncbi:hypothetical protein C1X35_16560 [Pseudomonas sp. FW306-1C-G01A]|nr:hypothetical protein C1X56_10975 [Pseudomonas sp. GW101-1A09]PMV90552.1 hypothetical protein C1X55_32610 [Pseudomonas sp. GW460-C8]PMV94256.1 hypothetical protein C1X51_12730 [Pseudomonas sp. FW306-2-2C-B10A]PMW05859.1 hypothetical protein C1X50_11420 [Pseudomonas sp. MPR-TSA4]PMW09698.1 hypothetical protein C1X40_32490 [Pseudomonas sp. GW456-11-11-14-TSB2]PMW12943.1 hypothetical protein C1X52_18245 [Pseudomonas sp. FW306-2-1A-C05A]PMW16399.1 hypothetical protein C1X53_24695 [Pseudomonas s
MTLPPDAYLLTVSRAGSLPHWFCVRHRSSVGASLLAMPATRSPSLPQSDDRLHIRSMLSSAKAG